MSTTNPLPFQYLVRAPVIADLPPDEQPYALEQRDRDLEDFLGYLDSKSGSGSVGPPGPQGPAGPTGPTGPAGVGVPTGGSAGQVLAKNTATDYDTGWITPASGGGGGSTILDGNGPPADALGAVGNYYEDKLNGVLYGPKGAGGTVAGAILSEPFNNLSNWTTVTGTPTIATGRTGTGVTNPSFDIRYTIPGASESATVIVGFAVYLTAYPAANAQFVWLWSDANATQHTGVRITNLGALQAQRSSTLNIGSPSANGVIPLNTWCYVEVKFVLDDVAGSVTARVNGTDVLTVTGVDTKNAGTKTVYDTVHLMGPTGTGSIFDDLYVKVGAGATFAGDTAIGPVWPVAVRTIPGLSLGTGNIADNAVTNAKLADVATATFKGRTTAGTGDPEDLTVTQAKTLLAYTKSDVGLGNVDNTSDANKPVSTAQATAIALKADKTTTISTTAPLTGGGDLSANRTLALDVSALQTTLDTRYVNVTGDTMSAALQVGAAGATNLLVDDDELTVRGTGPGLSYLHPLTGTATTPDPGVPPSDYTVVCLVNGPMRTGTATQQTIVCQWESAGTKSWLVRHYRDTGYFNVYQSPDGSDNYTYRSPYSASGGPGWHYMAVSVHYDAATPANGYVKTWLSDDGLVWTEISGVQQTSWPVPLDTNTVVRVGAQQGANGVWDGDIAWVEMRSGLTPTGGALLWRFDAADYPGSGTSYVDPRGRTWTLTNSSAITKATSTPTLKVQTNGGPTLFSGQVTLAKTPSGPQDAATKQYVDNAMNSVIAGGIAVGSITAYGGDTAPPGYLLADGSLYNPQDYPALFNVYGVKYGGDGVASFGVPNLKGRAVMMLDASVGVLNTLGKTGGSRDATLPTHDHDMTHTHPQHQHTISARTATGSAGGAALGGTAQSSTVPVTSNEVTPAFTGRTGTAGSSATDANLPPFLVLNYICKT